MLMLFEMIYYMMEVNVPRGPITMKGDVDLGLCVLRGRGYIQGRLLRGSDSRAEVRRMTKRPWWEGGWKKMEDW